jgi:hypothetical protein
MRRLALSFALLLAFAPAFAATSPATQPAAETAAAADVDRLLQTMDMKTMMAGMMQQAMAAQEQMVTNAFGKDLSEAKRKEMHDVMATTSVILEKHMRWEAIEPIIRKVYAQVFSKQEVLAMTAFYASPEGASILKKSPQAMAITMQEIQPIMLSAMQEVKAAIEQQTSAEAKK